MTQTHSGVSATPLSGLGTTRWYHAGTHFDPADVEPDDPETELHRFDEAQVAARAELESDPALTATTKSAVHDSMTQ